MLDRAAHIEAGNAMTWTSILLSAITNVFYWMNDYSGFFVSLSAIVAIVLAIAGYLSKKKTDKA